MKFAKGIKESVLWNYLHFSMFNYFSNDKYEVVNNLNRKFVARMTSEGVLKDNVEIIVKINGKIQLDRLDE